MQQILNPLYTYLSNCQLVTTKIKAVPCYSTRCFNFYCTVIIPSYSRLATLKTTMFLKMPWEDGEDIAILVTISKAQHGGQQQPLSTVSKVTQDNTKNVDIIANKYIPCSQIWKETVQISNVLSIKQTNVLPDAMSLTYQKQEGARCLEKKSIKYVQHFMRAQALV